MPTHTEAERRKRELEERAARISAERGTVATDPENKAGRQTGDSEAGRDFIKKREKLRSAGVSSAESLRVLSREQQQLGEAARAATQPLQDIALGQQLLAERAAPPVEEGGQTDAPTQTDAPPSLFQQQAAMAKEAATKIFLKAQETFQSVAVFGVSKVALGIGASGVGKFVGPLNLQTRRINSLDGQMQQIREQIIAPLTAIRSGAMDPIEALDVLDTLELSVNFADEAYKILEIGSPEAQANPQFLLQKYQRVSKLRIFIADAKAIAATQEFSGKVDREAVEALLLSLEQ